MEFGTQFRTVDTGGLVVPFSSGATTSIELPRSLYYKNIKFRLSGTITTTGTGVITTDNPLTLIRKIELVGDGVKVLWTVVGRDAYRLSQILTGKAGEFTGRTNTAAGTYPFSASFIIHNEAIRMGKPVDSYLDPRSFEKLELRVTWGTSADISTGDTTFTFNAGCQLDIQPSLSAEGEEHIGFRRILTYDETSISASNTSLPVNVPRIGFLAGVLIHADIDAAGSDTLINYISVKSDNINTHVDRLAWETKRRANAIDYGFDVVNNAGTLSNSGINGFVYLDFTEDGMLGSSLNTYGLNTLQLIYDVTSSGSTRYIRHTYVFYEPINVG